MKTVYGAPFKAAIVTLVPARGAYYQFRKFAMGEFAMCPNGMNCVDWKFGNGGYAGRTGGLHQYSKGVNKGPAEFDVRMLCTVI